MMRIHWEVVLLNAAFTLFQLLIQRAAAYQALNSSALLIFFLNICFVGLSLGMVLYARFSLWLGKRSGAVAKTLSLSLLAAPFLLQQPVARGSLFPLVLFCAGVLPSGLFGILLSPYASANALSFLLATTLGSLIGMAAYYFGLAHWPFFVSFGLVSICPLARGSDLCPRPSIRFFLGAIGLGVLSGLLLRLPSRYMNRSSVEVQVMARYFTPMGTTEILRSPDGVLRMMTDRQSPTHIARKGDIATVEPQARTPYLLFRPEEVLIIGAGGGQDLAAALHYGARSVTGIEMNGKRVQLMRGRFAAASNGLYLDPRIRILEDDARHAMRYLRDPYDLIVLQRPWTTYMYDRFLINTSASLMTEEAVAEYWRLLKPGGTLFIALPRAAQAESGPPRIANSLRANFSSAFLKEHLVVLEQGSARKKMLILLLSKSVFPRGKREALRKAGYDVVFFPGDAAPDGDADRLGGFFAAERPQAFKDKFCPPRRLRGGWNGPAPWLLLNMALVVLAVVGTRHRSFGAPHAIYVVLGMLYFWLEALLLLHSSLLLGNVMLVYYLAVPTFILTGGLGYLHASRSPDPRRVQAACFALMLLLLAVGGLDLLGFRTLGPWSERGLVASLCGLSGYLSAYPFGYLISREKEKLAAFAWDGFGMALGYPTLLILMSHATLDQLMIQLAAFYGPLALCIPLLSGASARRKI